MTKQRRSFSAEFKREAETLMLDQGCSPLSALRRWVNQLQLERSGITP